MYKTLVTIKRLVISLQKQNDVLENTKAFYTGNTLLSIQSQIDDNVTRITKLNSLIEMYK